MLEEVGPPLVGKGTEAPSPPPAPGTRLADVGGDPRNSSKEPSFRVSASTSFSISDRYGVHGPSFFQSSHSSAMVFMCCRYRFLKPARHRQHLAAERRPGFPAHERIEVDRGSAESRAAAARGDRPGRAWQDPGRRSPGSPRSPPGPSGPGHPRHPAVRFSRDRWLSRTAGSAALRRGAPSSLRPPDTPATHPLDRHGRVHQGPPCRALQRTGTPR